MWLIPLSVSSALKLWVVTDGIEFNGWTPSCSQTWWVLGGKKKTSIFSVRSVVKGAQLWTPEIASHYLFHLWSCTWRLKVVMLTWNLTPLMDIKTPRGWGSWRKRAFSNSLLTVQVHAQVLSVGYTLGTPGQFFKFLPFKLSSRPILSPLW